MCASDGKSGDEDVTSVGCGGADDGAELGDGFGEWSVVTIAVGTFKEDGIGLGEGFELLQDGRVHGAEVAGKNDSFWRWAFVDEELKAGGAEHVTRFGPDDFDSGSYGDGFAVRDGFEAGED